MSHYGTTEDYIKGYDDGADETLELHAPLVAAALNLLERWSTNKNLSEQIQALQRAADNLPADRRRFVE